MPASTADYTITDTTQIITPALIVFRERVEENLRRMMAIAGDASRLRPHCKTHKMAAVTRIEVEMGITKHKAATFAEAEMLAEAGAKDVLLAYNLVGPNIARAVRFVEKYPHVAFSCTADHPKPLRQLSEAMVAANRSIGVLVDINTGLNRTGLVPGEQARAIYRTVVELPGLVANGLHVYDGHQHQNSKDERRAAIQAAWKDVIAFRDSLLAEGWPVPRLVCGGTGGFPVYAEMDEPTIELSPGTCVFSDVGYSEMFPDMEFPPAAVLLTRVISRPAPDRVTLDLGYKAVAADQPMGRRVRFPALPDAEQVLQNEEHLVLKTSRAEEFEPGDELIAIPRHICPTSALHKQAYVIEDGMVVDHWEVTSRDRWLTI